MRAELGLRSPLDDRMGRRRALDDGAPLAADSYDDDDRRYAASTDNDYASSDPDFVDSRAGGQLRAHDGSEWDHLKRVVRDAWHRMTGHGPPH